MGLFGSSVSGTREKTAIGSNSRLFQGVDPVPLPRPRIEDFRYFFLVIKFFANTRLWLWIRCIPAGQKAGRLPFREPRTFYKVGKCLDQSSRRRASYSRSTDTSLLFESRDLPSPFARQVRYFELFNFRMARVFTDNCREHVSTDRWKGSYLYGTQFDRRRNDNASESTQLPTSLRSR